MKEIMNDTQHREAVVRLWFSMWLRKADLGISDIFAPDAAYIESWGPEYRGAGKIKHWFEEWNSRGTVLQWDIKQFFHQGDQTAVQWYFKDRMNDGRSEAFDGVSLVKWGPGGRIARLQEFGCSETRYDPYQDGPAPKFRENLPNVWF